MKKLNLDVDLSNVKLNKIDQDMPVIELVTEMMDQMMVGFANESKGLTDKQRRKYYRILDVFDAAKASKNPIIELEDGWYDFLNSCKTNGKFLPSRLLAKVEGVIENLVKEEPAKEVKKDK